MKTIRLSEGAKLSEISSEIIKEISNNRVLFLEAPCGCGKTTFIKSLESENPERIYYVTCINSATPKEISSTHRFKNGVQHITIQNLLKNVKEIPRNSILFFDEAHLLLTQDDFRNIATDVFQPFFNKRQDCKYVFLSATMLSEYLGKLLFFSEEGAYGHLLVKGEQKEPLVKVYKTDVERNIFEFIDETCKDSDICIVPTNREWKNSPLNWKKIDKESLTEKYACYRESGHMLDRGERISCTSSFFQALDLRAPEDCKVKIFLRKEENLLADIAQLIYRVRNHEISVYVQDDYSFSRTQYELEKEIYFERVKSNRLVEYLNERCDGSAVLKEEVLVDYKESSEESSERETLSSLAEKLFVFSAYKQFGECVEFTNKRPTFDDVTDKSYNFLLKETVVTYNDAEKKYNRVYKYYVRVNCSVKEAEIFYRLAFDIETGEQLMRISEVSLDKLSDEIETASFESYDENYYLSYIDNFRNCISNGKAGKGIGSAVKLRHEYINWITRQFQYNGSWSSYHSEAVIEILKEDYKFYCSKTVLTKKELDERLEKDEENNVFPVMAPVESKVENGVIRRKFRSQLFDEFKRVKEADKIMRDLFENPDYLSKVRIWEKKNKSGQREYPKITIMPSKHKQHKEHSGKNIIFEGKEYTSISESVKITGKSRNTIKKYSKQCI